jgi:DNA polymerase-3 subunit alpha
MNALYRPGPMQYIPVFTKRKHGKEKVEYPHPMLEEILKPTFGIMVYQEQIMQAAQIMGGFSLGKADILRRAMGKKDMKIMEEQKVIFIEGAAEKGVDKKNAEEVFATMQEFAKYGFNRSHSAAYSVIAYQTAYLKAHYPAEYMSAVLTNNLNDIKKITFFIDECSRQGIKVLGPSVNEGHLDFVVNKKGEIRFGMAAIKNVGESAVRSIIEEREENGNFTSIFDFVKRVNLRSVNKRSIESLAKAGAFDDFENTHRAQYFHRDHSEDSIFLEKVIKYGNDYQIQKSSSQVSLFGEMGDIDIKDPDLPECGHWSKLEQLKNEKEVTGFYMSGHPLENFKTEMDHFCNIDLTSLKNNMAKYQNKNLMFAGILTTVNHRTSQTGKPFATFVLEDFNDYYQFILFSEDYLKMKHMLLEGSSLFVNAKVQARNKKNTESLDVRINSITLLPEVLEKMTNELTITVNLMSIDKDFISDFANLTKSNKGTTRFKFHVLDEEDKLSVNLNSKNNKVDPLPFIRHMEQMPSVQFKIN